MTTRSKFRELKRGERCAVCGHNGRCKLAADSDELRLCFRVSDEWANGFRRIKLTGECATYVRVGSPADRDGGRTATLPRSTGDLDALAQRNSQAMTDERLQTAADQLGVSTASLRQIGIGLNGDSICFPERDANGIVVGINARLSDGRKLVGKGQHRGLIIPTGFAELPDPILIPEGPTDTAACLALSLSAVGRPNDRGGAPLLAALLEDRDVLVVGENDKKPDGSWPGSEGAKHVAALLAKAWKHPVRWSLPPEDAKDVRSWLRQRALNLNDESVRQAAGRELLQALESRAVSVEPPSTGTQNRGPSQATILVKIAEQAELFHNCEGVAYVTIEVNGHSETWPLRTREFRRWLCRQFYERDGRAPGSQAIKDALSVVEGKATYEGSEQQVSLRVGESTDVIYIDLCNNDWQVVEVTATGWRVVDRSPVKFRRSKGMLALPIPVRGGSVNDLRRFVNIGSDDEWVLMVSWLVAAFRPHGPYGILEVSGEQGSCKSTTCRALRRFVDPNKADLRSQPREERDLVISARNGWLIGLDNLSGIPRSLSDGLCRLACGGGFATRQLYSDSDETIFDVQRPVVVNGITELATNPDLIDRSIRINLPNITDGQRRAEDEFWADFERCRPGIIGGLLDAVATALRNVHAVRLYRLPRMADLAKWVVAAESALPWTNGAFMDAYAGNRASAVEAALEASPIGPAVQSLLAGRDAWAGTAAELLAALEGLVDDRVKRLRSWPNTPRGVSGALRRIAPNLRAVGIEITSRREGRQRRRIVTLEKVGETPSIPSAPSANTASTLGAAIDADGSGRTADGTRGNRPQENRVFDPEIGDADDVDEADGLLQSCPNYDLDSTDNEARTPGVEVPEGDARESTGLF